jgi:molecular chaperone HscB
MQWSVRINEAYQRLKDPLRRAAYLCELGGAAIRAESNTAMPAEFLMQQMAWREALDDARSAAEVEVLQAEVLAAHGVVLDQCAQALDIQRDFARAVSLVRSLMFVERFRADIDNRYDQLLESAPTVAPGPSDRAG